MGVIVEGVGIEAGEVLHRFAGTQGRLHVGRYVRGETVYGPSGVGQPGAVQDPLAQHEDTEGNEKAAAGPTEGVGRDRKQDDVEGAPYEEEKADKGPSQEHVVGKGWVEGLQNEAQPPDDEGHVIVQVWLIVVQLPHDRGVPLIHQHEPEKEGEEHAEHALHTRAPSR